MIKSISFISSENIHVWDSNNQYLVDLQFVDWSGITSFPLLTFKNIDAAINWLYVNGFKNSARELNKVL